MGVVAAATEGVGAVALTGADVGEEAAGEDRRTQVSLVKRSFVSAWFGTLGCLCGGGLCKRAVLAWKFWGDCGGQEDSGRPGGTLAQMQACKRQDYVGLVWVWVLKMCACVCPWCVTVWSPITCLRMLVVNVAPDCGIVWVWVQGCLFKI